MKKSFVCLAAVCALCLTTAIPAFAQTQSAPTAIEVQAANGEVLAGINLAARAQYGVITGDGVALRKTPSINGTRLGLLYKGDVVSLPYVSSVSADGYVWVNVIYNGTSGWVANNYVQEDY